MLEKLLKWLLKLFLLIDWLTDLALTSIKVYYYSSGSKVSATPPWGALKMDQGSCKIYVNFSMIVHFLWCLMEREKTRATFILPKWKKHLNNYKYAVFCSNEGMSWGESLETLDYTTVVWYQYSIEESWLTHALNLLTVITNLSVDI